MKGQHWNSPITIGTGRTFRKLGFMFDTPDLDQPTATSSNIYDPCSFPLLQHQEQLTLLPYTTFRRMFNLYTCITISACTHSKK